MYRALLQSSVFYIFLLLIKADTTITIVVLQYTPDLYEIYIIYINILCMYVCVCMYVLVCVLKFQ